MSRVVREFMLGDIRKGEVEAGIRSITIPLGSLVLSVGVRYNLPFVRVLCDADAPDSVKCFRVAQTGDPIESFVGGRSYLGSVTIRGVVDYHVFELE